MADKSNIVRPQGTDFISLGDEAITANAEVLASLWDLWSADHADLATAIRFRSNAALPVGDMNTWLGFDKTYVYRAASQGVVDGITGRPHGAKPGLIYVEPVGSTATIIRWVEFGELGKTYEMTASSNAAYAAAWQTYEKRKRAATSLTCGRANDVREVSDVAHAYPIHLAAKAYRWRFHVRNTNDRTTNTISGSLTLSLGIGKMERDQYGEASPNVALGTYRSIVTNAATSSAGSEYVSPWVEDYPLEKTSEYVLRLGINAGAGQTINYLEGGGWTIAGGTANMSQAAPSATITNRSPLDVWIEVEVDQSTPVHAYFGDSLTVGQGAALPVFQSWAAKHARQHGAIPMFYAHAGARMSEWTEPAHIKFRKYSLPTYTIAKPDALYFAMGSNDLFAEGKDVAGMLAAMDVTMPLLKAVTCSNVFFTTILPRHNGADPLEVNRKAWNDRLVIDPPHGGQITYDAAAALTEANGSEVDSRFTASETDIHLTNGGYSKFASQVS